MIGKQYNLACVRNLEKQVVDYFLHSLNLGLSSQVKEVSENLLQCFLETGRAFVYRRLKEFRQLGIRLQVLGTEVIEEHLKEKASMPSPFRFDLLIFPGLDVGLQ